MVHQGGGVEGDGGAFTSLHFPSLISLVICKHLPSKVTLPSFTPTTPLLHFPHWPLPPAPKAALLHFNTPGSPIFKIPPPPHHPCSAVLPGVPLQAAPLQGHPSSLALLQGLHGGPGQGVEGQPGAGHGDTPLLGESQYFIGIFWLFGDKEISCKWPGRGVEGEPGARHGVSRPNSGFRLEDSLFFNLLPKITKILLCDHIPLAPVHACLATTAAASASWRTCHF